MFFPSISPPTNANFFLTFRTDFEKIMYEKGTVTVEIPKNGWSLLIRYDKSGKYAVDVNGENISTLSEAPKTAAS